MHPTSTFQTIVFGIFLSCARSNALGRLFSFAHLQQFRNPAPLLRISENGGHVKKAICFRNTRSFLLAGAWSNSIKYHATTPQSIAYRLRGHLPIVRGGCSDSLRASRGPSVTAAQDIEDLGVNADFSDEEAASISSKCVDSSTAPELSR